MIVRFRDVMTMVCLVTASVGPVVYAAGSGGKSAALDIDRLINDWRNDRNSQWDALVGEGGVTKDGLRAAVSLSKNPVAIGSDFQLNVNIRNITELPSGYTLNVQNLGRSLVLVRDQNGKPIRLSDAASRRIADGFHVGSVSLVTKQLTPGAGFTETYPLSKDFAFEKAGKYTVFAVWLMGRDGPVVSTPLSLMLNDNGENQRATPTIAEPRRIPNPVGNADDDWNRLLKTAGAEHDGYVLSGVLSPYSPNAVHLVLSVTCIRNTSHRISPNEDYPAVRTIKVGQVGSNYRILIHDSVGNLVGMTKFGRQFFEHRCEESAAHVSVGDSVGAWLPLDDLFDLKSNEEYTVLAIIPDAPDAMKGLVSAPIRVRSPKLMIAGVTRPLYGSDVLWAKLVARASGVNPLIVGGFKMAQTDSNFEYGQPQIALRNVSGAAFGPEATSAETTVLVRDGRGRPILPVTASDPDDAIDKMWPGWAERLKEKRRTDTFPFHRIGGSTVIETVPRFPGRFPILPGQPYSIIVAVRFRGENSSSAVVGPITYVPRSICDFRVPKEVGSPRILANPEFKVPLSLEGQRDSLMLFAGRPFRDLLLTAIEGKPGELNVSLVNHGKQSIVVKKWQGLAGFDVQLRDSDGKKVILTEKGKATIEGGTTIDSYDIEPRKAIDLTVSVPDLFAVKRGAEYSVLVSVPIVGEVDAVLTAAPLKIRIR
jgi:hypothetical protein